ncbi:hypothetical protein [Altererythrobacter sp. ZODW24]|uniref:hypothetical protein n=1 Tax=Altererythrobacter sp. ZODW24 TaxID=2185142 RepID=UPI000DF74456|nr:hypothetical protein [Altererythrobacter sp. ZODW24]
MKNAHKLIAASTLAIATSAFAAPALAGGVDAGTLIENTASASYTVGGVDGSVDSNTVEILVDELLDVAVATLDGAPGSAVLTFSVTNTGNGPEAFALTADPAVVGNDYDVTVDSIAIDTNGNGVYDDGVDTILPAGGATPLIDPDDAQIVFVLVTNPTGTADGDTSQVELTAEAVTGTGAPGDTFAGQGEGGGDAVVGTTGADDEDLGDLIAAAIAVELAKSATVADPFGGTEAVPGAVITYSITASVMGTGTVNDLLITDAIPADTTYTVNTLTFEGAARTDAADGDNGQASAAGVEVLIGDAVAGSAYTITFAVTID